VVDAGRLTSSVLTSNITRLTIFEPGDLLTAIRIPSTWGRWRNFHFEKESAETGMCGTSTVERGPQYNDGTSGRIERIRLFAVKRRGCSVLCA